MPDSTPETTPVLLDLVRDFIQLVRRVDPAFGRAYWRFMCRPSEQNSKASYTSGGETLIVDVLQHRQAIQSMADKGATIFTLGGHAQGVMLLTVDSSNRFDAHFDYDDLDRWSISKVDGGTGVPIGFDPANPNAFQPRPCSSDALLEGVSKDVQRPSHRDFKMTTRNEPRAFRWLVLFGFCLAIAMIVAGLIRATH